MTLLPRMSLFFFFNDTATTEIYTLSLHDALPILTLPPAGSLSISGTAMAAFMIAHLQKGAFGSGRILQEATAVKMHGTAATVIPQLNRMLLGFYENNINGHRVITHWGDTEYLPTELNLLADDGV